MMERSRAQTDVVGSCGDAIEPRGVLVWIRIPNDETGNAAHTTTSNQKGV